MNDAGRVDGWAERILLGPVSSEGDTIKIPSGNVPSSPEIVIDIKKRA